MELEENNLPEWRRIGLRLQGVPRGAYFCICNPWRNAEDGAIDKSVG